MNENTRVLAITESSMGHKTHSLMMRKYFESSVCQVDIYWSDQEKELFLRILNKIISLRIPNKLIQSYNLDFFRVRAQLGYGLLTRRLIERKLSQQKYDQKYNVLYFHTQPLAFLSLDIMRKTPSVISIDMTNIQASEECNNHKYKWTYNPNIFLEKQVFKRSAKILTWTEWARNSVINDYGIDPDKVSAVPPGVDTKLIAFTSRDHKSNKEPYNVLFIGGDFKRKGGEDLLDVFLNRFADDSVLHIVTLDVINCNHPNVHIYNHVQAYSDAWLQLYRQADVFVMPTYGDAFGLVFIEAMAFGLPVIASKLIQTTEIVKEGETGFLITPGDRQALGDTLQVLIDNPSLGRQMGEKARQVVEVNFDTHKNFKKIESIFEQLQSKAMT